MPLAATFDRLKLEEQLSREMRAALLEACRLWEVPRRCWLEVPALRRFFVAAAVYSLEERLQDEGASAPLLNAAAHLGLDGESALRARRRLRERADSLSSVPDPHSSHVPNCRPRTTRSRIR